MKTSTLKSLFLFVVIALGLSSCAVNQFSSRKNFHSRVKVDIDHSEIDIEPVNSEAVFIPVKNTPSPNFTESKKETSILKTQPTKPTLSEKVVKIFFPKKNDTLRPILHPQKNKLPKGNKSSMDGDRILGLILGIISLAMAIGSGFMILGMATGNILVYFAIGMLMAVLAIALGAIGKRLPFKGLSIAGFILGIIAVVALLVMLITFTVLGLL